ncbi:MAG: hypothetical protein ACRYG2_13460 [Janthinobacterium lividum]
MDRTQPVALVLDSSTGEQLALLEWSQAPAGPSPEQRIVLAGEDGLWVQQHGGPLVLVGEDGALHGRYVSDTALGAVSAHGAWCAPEPRAQDIAVTPDAPPSDYRTSTRLRLARRDQLTRTVRVDAPVQSLRAFGGDLYVEVETGTWNRRNIGTPTSWDLQVETSWLRFRADQDVPDQLSIEAHSAETAPPPLDSPSWRWGHLPDPRDLTDDNAHAVRAHAQTPGLDWFVGADRAPIPRPEQLFAVAYETGTARERWRLTVGVGEAAAVAATGCHLWVAVQHPPDANYRPSSQISVVRLDADTGHVETVVDPGSVDITDLGWSTGPPPVDAKDYTSYWRQRLSSLDAFWTDDTGHVGPLSEGLSDTRVEVVGAWPDTTLHVTFSWTHRPGVRLRRIISLYDDLGRPDEPTYAEIDIMEDLDTRCVPGPPTPGTNFLDF